MQFDTKSLLRKKASTSRRFKNPLEKFRLGFRQAVEQSKAMTPEQITADWNVCQKQRLTSGTNFHVPNVVLISPINGSSSTVYASPKGKAATLW